MCCKQCYSIVMYTLCEFTLCKTNKKLRKLETSTKNQNFNNNKIYIYTLIYKLASKLTIVI